MASVMTTDFVRSVSHAETPPFSLIEQRSLTSRLLQELEAAFGDLVRDPRAFFSTLVTRDTRDEKRRQRIYLGLACAIAAHVALIVVIAVVGLRTAFVKNVEETPADRVVFLPLSDHANSTKHDIAKGEAGGGGGGQRNPLPPSRGTPPRMLPQAQIIRLNPSSIPEPTLPVLPTVVGPESAPPPPAPIGDPTGKTGEFSAGPGSGGGIGRTEGTGVGDGKGGGGVGPGAKGGKGGGPAGSPDGESTVGEIAFNARKPTGFSQFTWSYRARAIITPEAQANKVMGTVLLRATFRADGTITDIEVVNQVPFMTESAIESLKRSKFRPATINGVPVTLRRVLVSIEVHY